MDLKFASCAIDLNSIKNIFIALHSHHLRVFVCVSPSVVCVDTVCGTVLIVPALRLQSVQALWSSLLDLVWRPALIWTRGPAQSPSMAASVLREPCFWCVRSFISLFNQCHYAVMQDNIYMIYKAVRSLSHALLFTDYKLKILYLIDIYYFSACLCYCGCSEKKKKSYNSERWS